MLSYPVFKKTSRRIELTIYYENIILDAMFECAVFSDYLTANAYAVS